MSRPESENQMLCTVESFNIQVSGRKSRDAVIGTNNFPAYPQNKNSCVHAVRNQPVAAPLFWSEKRFGPKTNVGLTTKFLVQKQRWLEKNFGPKSIGPKKILVQKKFWSDKKFGPKFFLI